MQKRILLILLAFLYACLAWGQGTVTTEPASLDANQQGKIFFTASAKSPLYNYTGDVYVHIGVVDGTTWNYVPADWNENIDKCRMTREADNKWSVTLAPTIREWFGATTPVKKIGLVFRNEDGTKKGIAADQFVTVKDENLFVSISGVPTSGVVSKGTKLAITVTATQKADLSLDIIDNSGSGGMTFQSETATTSMTADWTFSIEGSFTLKAKAKAGTATNQCTASVTVRGAIVKEPRPAGTKEGINIINPTTATFVLFDSDKNGSCSDCVYWIGDLNQWTPQGEYMMKRDDANKCWWITLSGLDPQKEYAFQYLVLPKNGSPVRIGDPYCTKILDPWNDKYISENVYPGLREYPSEFTYDPVSVFSTSPSAYKWQVTDFKITNRDNLTIYELLLRDFTDAGTLKAAMEKLPYLQSLGVNAIELMPVQEFDGNISWGYNPSYFFALDKAYGTDDDYRRFIDECHKLGIAVFFDVVYNHATGNHPYCKMWWNGTTNKPAANNPWFNVDAPHPYSVFNDFNHECAEVRAFVKRNLQYLLTEYKIDGFRFDLTKGFTQRSCNESTASNYDASRIAILKDYHSAIKSVRPDACMICEHFCAESEEKALAQDGIMVWRKMNEAYCQSAMGYQENSSFTALYANNSGMPYNSLVGYMESHDEQRTQYKAATYGTADIKNSLEVRMNQAVCNAALFLTVPGPKMIWQLGELGYDISGGNGDTDPKAPHWEYSTDPNRHKLYMAYAKLNTLRNAYPELFATNASFSWQAGQSNWTDGRYAYLASADGTKHVVVAANFTGSNATYSLNFAHSGTWNELLGDSKLNVTGSVYRLPVPAHSCVVYTDFTVTGIEDVHAENRTFSVYPNPATDVICTDVAGSLTVMNLSGSILKQAVGNSINISELPAGIYILNIKNDDANRSAKFIKR